ncbi:uncharacterized protein SCHCODRAFT_0235600 [Schizophyllum commune H4-8]|uniref:Uncharacterized protein n=1 Tax=Schizophyllum commune (strain H4-8 / FGSC 9210) TaxID=578458 RepID=D8Q8C4_SCHCM|nr:uncharacterized protein SCHCODRAFT_0235600 [Schizophyllum commune H4-8]KAI5891113.1 hypothetical protein SCHCODRAFT_0235600 [Schizophyllum commune H4-8]
MAADRKQRTKKVVVSYTASAGHIGRNPGRPKKLARQQELGILSILPPTKTLCPATPSTELDPHYPHPYWHVHCQVGSAAKMAQLIKAEASAHTPSAPFGVEINQLQSDNAAVAFSRINAPDLVFLSLNKGGTTNITPEARAQVSNAIKYLIASRLVKFLYHAAGNGTRDEEADVYTLCRRAANTLTHLSLELSFCDKKALLAYLCSQAAAGLVSLELKSNTSLQTPLVNAFKAGKLPNLRSLSLDLPPSKTNVTTLVAALRMRYNAGHSNALQIELKNEISDALRAEATAIAVTFVEYCAMRF